MIPFIPVKTLAVVAAILAVLYAASRLVEYGRVSATAEITRSNETAAGTADKAEHDVLDCPLGRWNREARKCER
jgi:hypothetical protein